MDFIQSISVIFFFNTLAAILFPILKRILGFSTVNADLFMPLKELSKFFIIIAMLAIGLNSNLIKMIKNGGKAILFGATCWIAITVVSLILQNFMNIW